MASFTAAVVQAAPVVFDAPRRCAKLADLTADAAHTGATLVVFPEAFVSAYPKGLDFGARVGMRSPEGREQFRRYFESAIDVPGPATEAIVDGRAAAPRAISSSASSSATAARCTARRCSSPPTARCSASTAS